MGRTLALACVLAGTVCAQQPFDPPTWADRRQVFFQRLVGPQAILATVPGAAIDTARVFPRQWGDRGSGMGKRLGSRYGQFAVGEAIEMGVAALHKEDTRYFRMPNGRFGKRLGHALLSTVVVRGVGGRPTIGLAGLANSYGRWAVASTWKPPDQRNAAQILRYGSMGIGIRTGANVFQEFWPDLKRRFRRP